MGKSEIGTAKYYSKKLKSSGLQKTSFYCQICEKQCRDLNGFKNHKASSSHLSKVADMVDTKGSKNVINDFSSRFEQDFLKLLKLNHGTKWIEGNKFYQEYIINDKNHVHLNSTKWINLTNFLKYLGKSGKVKVENLSSEGDDDAEGEGFRFMIKFNDGTIRQEQQEEKPDDGMDKFISKQLKLGQQEIVETPKTIQKVEGPIRLNLKKTNKIIKPSVFDDDSD